MTESPTTTAPTPTSPKLEFSREPKVENLLDQWRISWDYVPDYPLDKIRSVAGQQVRMAANIARRETVDQYVEQARNGAKFPPIVLAKGATPDSGNEQLDGNTRVAMAHRLGLTSFPAYVVRISSADYGKALAAALNQLGGQRLTEDEVMTAAIGMLSENVGFNDEEIAAAVGVTASKVRNWRKARDAEQHAKRVGIATSFETVPTAQKKLLAKVTQDAPFKAITELVGNRRVLNDDVRRLVDDVVKAPSEEIAMERISDLAETLPAGGPKGVAPVANQKARRMRMLLPQIHNLYPPEEMFEADRAQDDQKAWLRVQDITESMLAMYAERLDTPALAASGADG